MNSLKRGFTLIELLVVIAIIGILSGIVLASLNSARQKGQDASTKATLSNIRSQAAIVYDGLNNYGIGIAATAGALTACASSAANSLFATSTISNMVTSVNATAYSASQCRTDGESDGAPVTQNWIMKAELRGSGSGGTYWCVDSNGASKATSTNLTANDGYNC